MKTKMRDRIKNSVGVIYFVGIFADVVVRSDVFVRRLGERRTLYPLEWPGEGITVLGVQFLEGFQSLVWPLLLVYDLIT